MSRETKRLVAEMSVGAGLFGLAAAMIIGIVCWVTGRPVWPELLGLLTGVAASIVMLIHMAVITERVIDSRDAGYANRTTLIHAMIRKVVLVVLIVIVWYAPGIDVLTMILGAFALKAGAYLQPQIHKLSIFERKEDSTWEQ